MQEFHLRIAGQLHHGAIHLIAAQQRNTLCPLLFGFAHRYPHVGVDKVRVLHACGNIFRQGYVTAVLLRQRFALCDQARFWPAFLWCHQTQIETG